MSNMSSQPSFNLMPAAIGEVEHIHFLSEHIGALYLNDEYSDVTLIVEGVRFHAHKVILAARSEYFRALLFGGMKESQLSDIELKDTPLGAFKHLLRYIYTGFMNLGSQKDELILDILGLAHQYGFQDLETSISDYLRAVLAIKNVCLVYDTASLYGLDVLVASCGSFMDRHAVDVIQHESFVSLSADGVRQIISRDSFCAPEVDIFRAIHKWVTANSIEEEEAARILNQVRLPLMSTQDLLKVVRPTSLVQPDVLLDAIQSRTESRDMELKYRGYLIPEENVATPRHGAVVLVGEVKQALLDGDTKNYDMERGFSRHPIDDTQDKGIIVRLGMQCIINHFKMLLWDRDKREYSYYIDVSMDQKDWVRVVDHTKHLCRSWQSLYFSPRVVRYIRIVGTYNTANKVFHVVSLEASYTKVPFSLDHHGIIIPKHNVATIAMSACVIEGVCRSRNALLNGDTNNYDWDSGYTCHQLGSGAIVVQLGQPYALDSMRLLLWDCDDRSYSYYVEVSNNNKDWDVVCDRSKQPCRSWQHMTFHRRPVVFIRIVGTHNTANEVFHCVHFECPATAATSTTTASSSDFVTNQNKNANSNNPNQEILMEETSSTSSSEHSSNHEDDTAVAADQPDHVVNPGARVSVEDNVMMPNNNNDEDESSHLSQHSSPASCNGSVSGQQGASGGANGGGLPIGASACSMARQQQLHNTVQLPQQPQQMPPTSPQGYDFPPSPFRSRGQIQQRGSVHSLPGAVAMASSGTKEAAEDASSSMTAVEFNRQGSGSGSSSRVYQHASSVRVPSAPQGLSPAGGAIPRRNSRMRSQQNSGSSGEQ